MSLFERNTIIAFTGPRGVGKTTLANSIIHEWSGKPAQIHKISFADPLRDLAGQWFGYEFMDALKSNLKDSPAKLKLIYDFTINKLDTQLTNRDIVIKLADFIKSIDPKAFLNATEKEIDSLFSYAPQRDPQLGPILILIDDLRFDYEIEMIRNLENVDVFIIGLSRSGVEDSKDHKFSRADAWLINFDQKLPETNVLEDFILPILKERNG